MSKVILSRWVPRQAQRMGRTFVLVAGLAAGVGLADRWDWSQREPKVAWEVAIGAGFSSVAVDDGRVFAFGNVADEDIVTALDADRGEVRWQYRYPCRAMGIAKPDEPGPRATPFVHAGAVYTLSRDGRLLCLDAATGRLRWWRDLPGEVGEKPPYWGFSGSPLRWNDLLIWSVGDHGLAIRASSGEVAWKSTSRASTVWKTEPVGTSGYTTPQPVIYQGRQLVSLANESQWVIVDPADGKLVWATPWEVPYGVTSAEPFLAGDRVVLSGGYGYGTRVVRIGSAGEPLWANKNLRSHFANLAVVGEHLYGIDGNQQDGGRCELRCLRLADGEVVWARERFGFANLTLVDQRLLILTARGELVVVQPDPSGYRETGRIQVLGGESWTAPLVAGNRVFARNKQGTLVRVDLP
ncbi:MAG: PQQ-binding-like beta-propeller repeat protein [Verrucomicrobia bacterium]|nr:PQQ-binding-like beta-propeller repeat protein [Verrucomicrobiota bacterium]